MSDEDDLFLLKSDTARDDMIAKIQATVKKHNKYPFTSALLRNIILMGRSRTGKSTVAYTLEKADYIPQNALQLFSETKTIETHTIGTRKGENGNVITLNIIDTPGFFDQATKQGRPLTNDYINDLIQQCLVKKTTDIHCFAFVFNLASGINQQDIQSMIYVKNNYGMIKKHLILLVTNCEELDETERERRVKDFFEHPEVKKWALKDFFGAGVFFMGCLRHELNKHPNLASAAKQIKNIMEMRHKLLDYLYDKSDRDFFNIHAYNEQDKSSSSSFSICSQQ